MGLLIVGYKSLFNYLLDFVTRDKSFDSLSQDFLISKMVKNILSWRSSVTGITYQKYEVLYVPQKGNSVVRNCCY